MVDQVRFITGNKILRILKGKGMAPELPEDCYYLIKKAVSIRWVVIGIINKESEYYSQLRTEFLRRLCL